MSKGYIKKERLGLLNTKFFFFKHSEGNHSYSTYNLSQRGVEITRIVHTVSHSVEWIRPVRGTGK